MSQLMPLNLQMTLVLPKERECPPYWYSAAKSGEFSWSLGCKLIEILMNEDWVKQRLQEGLQRAYGRVLQ